MMTIIGEPFSTSHSRPRYELEHIVVISVTVFSKGDGQLTRASFPLLGIQKSHVK